MPLINLSAYWFLWSMFLVIDYTANMQCSIACNPFKKLTCLPLFWNQNFLTCHNRFFTKIFLPHFGRWDANVMTLPNQLAPKQITNLQNTTAWLQNSARLYKKIYLNDFRLGILGNTKVREKSEIGWRQMLVPSLPFRNIFLVIAVKNYTWKM